MDENAGGVAICYINQNPVDTQQCPLGKDECNEECDEYFIVYSG